MKIFATFIGINCITKEPYIPCGMDSYLRLDGRKNFHNLTIDCLNHMEKLKNITKFIGFQIRGGSIKNSRVLLASKPELEAVEF